MSSFFASLADSNLVVDDLDQKSSKRHIVPYGHWKKVAFLF